MGATLLAAVVGASVTLFAQGNTTRAGIRSDLSRMNDRLDRMDDRLGRVEISVAILADRSDRTYRAKAEQAEVVGG